MKIAVYYPWIHLTSGIERTLLELAKLNHHEWVFFTNHFDQNATYRQFKNVHVIELSRVPVSRDLISVLKAAFIIATQKIDLSGFDLLMVHSDGLADLVLIRNNHLPTLCYCHTPLRPVFDRFYRNRVLKNQSLPFKVSFHILAATFKIIDRLLWQRYQHIIFNSRETVNRALSGNLINKSNQNYSIIHPGVTIRRNLSVTYQPFFLLPGRIMWTKNIELGIKSFIKFKASSSSPRFKLVIAGLVDHKSHSYFQKLKSLAANYPDISFIPNPTEPALHDLYSRCYAVLATAFNEDWGLTALEANAHAKPIIAVNRGGFAESQIDGQTALLCPTSTVAFSSALQTLAHHKNTAKRMGTAGRLNAERYTWSQFRHELEQRIQTICS